LQISHHASAGNALQINGLRVVQGGLFIVRGVGLWWPVDDCGRWGAGVARRLAGCGACAELIGWGAELFRWRVALFWWRAECFAR
jgi:hypothetical protein